MSNILAKTNIHAIFATDQKKEEEGTWIEVNNFMGLKIKIRRLRADAATKDFEARITDRYGDGKLRELQKVQGDEATEILKLQLLGVLIDWTGLVDTEAKVKKGEPAPQIPYSEELAIELLGIKDFREFVFQNANERDSFREKNDKAAGKNSPAS